MHDSTKRPIQFVRVRVKLLLFTEDVRVGDDKRDVILLSTLKKLSVN